MEQNSIDLGKKFVEIVENLIGEEKLTEFKKRGAAINGDCAVKCDDQYVAIIEIGDQGFKFSTNNISKEKRKLVIGENKNPNIVLLLESPHKDEFEQNNGTYTCVGPAIGKTGDNISKYILSNLALYMLFKNEEGAVVFNNDKIIKNGKYNLVLVNPIQYQCSLGEDLKNSQFKQYKTKIFDNAFHSDLFKKNFIERVNEYKPFIIINCCTGFYKIENEKYNLRETVQVVINDNLKNIIKLQGHHPSSPYFRNGFWNCK